MTRDEVDEKSDDLMAPYRQDARRKLCDALEIGKIRDLRACAAAPRLGRRNFEEAVYPRMLYHITGQHLLQCLRESLILVR